MSCTVVQEGYVVGTANVTRVFQDQRAEFNECMIGPILENKGHWELCINVGSSRAVVSDSPRNLKSPFSIFVREGYVVRVSGKWDRFAPGDAIRAYFTITHVSVDWANKL